MNTLIFKIVAYSLSFISHLTGLSYKQINVIVYYFLIPFTWLVLLDGIFHSQYLKLAFVVFTLGFIVGCRDFRTYSDWLFDKSVSFLYYFKKFGIGYVTSSVWICVSLPIVIYCVLLYFVFK